MFTVPATASSSGRWPGTSTTPGCTSSRTCSVSPTVPRSLNRRTRSPSRRPRAAASVGMQHAERRALALAQEADAGKRSVALEISRRGQQTQRPLRLLCAAAGSGCQSGIGGSPCFASVSE